MKKLKLFLAPLLALALVLGALPTAIMAEPLPDDATLEAYITKIIKAPKGIDLPDNLVFDFTITPVSVDGDESQASKMPTIQDAKIIFDASTAVVSSDLYYDYLKQEVKVDIDLEPEHGAFGVKSLNDLDLGTGIYLYKVEEVIDTNTLTPGTTASGVDYEHGLNYSAATYYIYICVAECEGTDGTASGDPCLYHTAGDLYTYAVLVVTGTDDAGTDIPAEKVKAGEGEYGMAFTNTYWREYGEVPPTDGQGQFYVEKIINGSKSSFKFAVTVTASDEYMLANPGATPAYWASIMEESATPGVWTNITPATANDDPTYGYYYIVGSGGTLTVNLSNGQRLAYWNNLDVSATYAVTEEGADQYLPQVFVVHNDTAIGGRNGVTNNGGADFSIPDIYVNAAAGASSGVIDTLRVGDVEQGASYASFVNSYQNTPPTGIALNGMSYIGLIILAVGGLLLFVALKRRKKNDEAEDEAYICSKV